MLRSDDIDIRNCRSQSQSYDNQREEHVWDLFGCSSPYAKVDELAVWVPCAAHSLNLIGASAADCCKHAVNFFGNLQLLY
jgi:hypothetical protein